MQPFVTPEATSCYHCIYVKLLYGSHQHEGEVCLQALSVRLCVHLYDTSAFCWQAAMAL